jgi:hypothetical protein
VLAVAGLLGLSPTVASARGDKDCENNPAPYYYGTHLP